MEAKNDTSDYKFSVKNKKKTKSKIIRYSVFLFFSSDESGEHKEE